MTYNKILVNTSSIILFSWSSNLGWFRLGWYLLLKAIVPSYYTYVRSAKGYSNWWKSTDLNKPACMLVSHNQSCHLIWMIIWHLNQMLPLTFDSNDTYDILFKWYIWHLSQMILCWHVIQIMYNTFDLNDINKEYLQVYMYSTLVEN